MKTYNSRIKAKPKVVVLGGGFGGLESALYLRKHMPDQAEITLVSNEDYFLFKPNTIYVPFGLDPNKLKLGLARPTRRKDIRFVQARALEIDPISRHVGLDSYSYGYKVAYDYLVVATGASMKPDTVPGLSEFAHPIWTPDNMLRLRSSFQQLVAEAKEVSHQGNRRRVLFLVPPNNNHSGPLYEMTLMLDTWLRRKNVRENVDVVLSTYEEEYIQAFGPKMHDVVSQEFVARGITGYSRYAVDRVERGEAIYRNGERLPFDLLVTLPPYVASTRFTSLPVDARGFISTDLASRQVTGHPEMYAVGDTADFPIKQAYLAARQADAAADHLSSQVLGTVPQVDFEPSSMYVMEGFDRATFVQVPLRLTGIPDRPIEVSTEDEDSYRVGSSRMWRLGKLALGVYLPSRFKAGNPFHAGAPWKGLEAGVKLMSGLMAR
ncbi:MAG TPA: FAD-dependent oxidoreductase [Chloroflexia bacterium]|nr:FAD-dependent oxidoreductase [Chloroflexia bacterium]